MIQDELSGEQQTHRYQIDPSSEEASGELLRIVADLKGREIEELPTFWRRIDSLVENLFSDPPSDEADACVTFSYAGYRITVRQSGDVKLVEEPGVDDE